MPTSIPSRFSRRSRTARVRVAAIALATSLALAPVARAADTFWTGATSGAWGTAGNWSAGVPTSADNAQLLSGYPNTTITLAGSNTANQLQVWSNAIYELTSSAPATLTLSDQLYVFSDPAASTLTIGGSLAVTSPNGSIGTGSGDVGGALLVNGGGASVAIANTFNVGYDGASNQLDVLSGTFSANILAVGGTSTALNNSVTVAGGALNATNSLVVGVAGSINSLYGSSGSITVTGPGGTEIGTDASAQYNAVTLAGASFTGTGTLIVGRAGSYNEFSVSNGSVATTGQARIGLDSTARYNVATVSGSGSQWTANGTLRVGSEGRDNSLVVENGGTMTVAGAGRNLWIGFSGSSGNNMVAVRGAGSLLDVSGAGSEIVVSGLTTGNGNYLEILDSGTVNTSSVQLGPGGTLLIGGTSGQAPGYLNSSATITGNDGGLGSGGGAVGFNHNASSYQFANVMSGSLSVAAIGTGTTTLTGSSSYTGLTIVADGRLALGANASIASSPEIDVYLGATFDVSAVAGGYQLAAGQTLGTAGTVIGPATGVVGSTVSPGSVIVGTATFTGGLTLLGDLAIDIDGSTIDLVDGSSGSLTLGGSVTFNEISAPSGNLIFAKYLSLTGVFGTVNGLPSGYSIDYNYLGGNQIALVAGSVVPEIDPASAGSVLALVGGALGMLERRRRKA